MEREGFGELLKKIAGSSLMSSFNTKLAAVAALWVAFALLCADASLRGRELQMASASASASSSGTGGAFAFASSTSTGGGTSSARVSSTATDGSTARGSVTSVSTGSGEASGSVDVTATGGGDASADLTVVADDKAKAIVEQVVAADGDKKVASTAFVQAVRDGNANEILLVLDNSFSQGVEFFKFTAEAVSIAIGDVIKANPQNTASVVEIITAGLTADKPSSQRFGEVIKVIVETMGCDFISGVLVESEAAAVRAGADRAYVEAIADFPIVLTCVYGSPCLDPILSACCTSETRSVGFCQCTPGTTDNCRYHLFWISPRPIWNCISNDCTRGAKCMCPSA